MKPKHFLAIAVLLFFGAAMVYPLSFVLSQAFVVDGSVSPAYFRTMLSSAYFRDVLFNSMNLAIAVSLLASATAYPIALLMSRCNIPKRGMIHALLLLPLVSPPFVGALGVRQVFSRFGSVNILLLQSGLIERPLQWLGSGSVLGVLALQTIHLVPILYLTISASLRSAHISLEEAASLCGASRWQVLRRVTIPLSFPGWFAGATLVFIASFTDLGTPLIFECRNVIPVQIYNMLSDIHENPVGYSFVVFTCVLCLALFTLSRTAMSDGSYAGSARAKQARLTVQMSGPTRVVVLLLLLLYIALSTFPQLAVVTLSLSKEWFFTVLPSRWTLTHFYEVLAHPMTSHSLMVSMGLSLCTSAFTVVVGFITAYLIARTRGFGSRSLEVLSVIPLAIPGIVFAFGYIGAFAGTFLDNRINPFPLLITAYSVRRLPAMVRSCSAGLAEANTSLEEAAHVLGATPFYTARRILMPVISHHLIVGAILTFAYSMIEVSDSILLAMEVKFYPVSKAIYALTARPDGLELACALGSLVMGIMLLAFFCSEWISIRAEKKRTVAMVIAALVLFVPGLAYTQEDELIAVSPHWEGIKEEFEVAFAQSHRLKTGRSVKIRWLDIGGTSDIVKYLKTQHRATGGNSNIDLIFGGGTDSLMELARAGILQPTQLSPEITNALPERLGGVQLYDKERRWYTAALSAFGIVVNRVAAKQLGIPTPSTWRDLANPVYFDLVGAADPRKSGSMHAMYEVILQGYGWDAGWELLGSIARNVRSLSGTASQVGKDVGTGEVVVGIAIDTYAGDLIRQFGAERIEFVAPTDYTSVNGDGIALISGAPHPNLAREFIEFVLSETGQKIWYLKVGSPGGPRRFEMGKLPILPSVYGSGPSNSVLKGPPDSWTNVLAYNSTLAGERWNLVNDLFGVFIIDVHDRLVQVARRSPQAPPPKMPIGADEARALSPDGTWGANATVRNVKLREWGEQATHALPRESTALDSIRWVPSAILLSFLVGLIVRRIAKRRR